MGEMFFAVKATIITLVMVFFMQIKVGQFTIEENAYHWIKSSYLVVELNQVSRGAVVALREAYQGISSRMTSKVKKTFKDEFSPGERSIIPSLKRSDSYLSELKKKAQEVDLDEVKQKMESYNQQLKNLDDEISQQGRSRQ
ncbi:MAG: hypothetical protein VX583_04655 [Bdellovibrionota bacterium]|nr:hypothetical protein [Pseudobdellovibrionaceae bacterium]|tara:strand:- start:19588 stop:20010 length:423 start_codon:yes stop_codon:yes gene_type:complete